MEIRIGLTIVPGYFFRHNDFGVEAKGGENNDQRQTNSSGDINVRCSWPRMSKVRSFTARCRRRRKEVEIDRLTTSSQSNAIQVQDCRKKPCRNREQHFPIHSYSSFQSPNTCMWHRQRMRSIEWCRPYKSQLRKAVTPNFSALLHDKKPSRGCLNLGRPRISLDMFSESQNPWPDLRTRVCGVIQIIDARQNSRIALTAIDFDLRRSQRSLLEDGVGQRVCQNATYMDCFTLHRLVTQKSGLCGTTGRQRRPWTAR